MIGRVLLRLLPASVAAEVERERALRTARDVEVARLRAQVEQLRAALRAERRRNLDAGQVRAQRDSLKHELERALRARDAAVREVAEARRQNGGDR